MKMLALALILFAQNSVEVHKNGTVKLQSGGQSLTIKADLDEDEDEGLVIVQNDEEIEERCDGQTPVTITGNHNKIALTGDCKDVSITGNYNVITIVRVKNLELPGNHNEVTAAQVGFVSLPGSRNTVRWRAGLTPKRDPRIEKIGRENKVTREKE